MIYSDGERNPGSELIGNLPQKDTRCFFPRHDSFIEIKDGKLKRRIENNSAEYDI